MKDGVELKTKRKKQNFFLPCKSITTSILIRDFFGFNAGMASKGGTSEGCLGLPSISRRWKQHESWSTRERPTQLNVVKLGISPALQVCVCVIGSGAALPLRLRWFQRTFPRWDESYQKECNHSINGRESATVKSTGMSITSWFFQRNHTTTWKSSPQQTPSWRWLKKKIHPATTPCKVVVLFLFLSSARNHRFTIRIYSPEAPRGSFSLSLFILTFSTHTGGKKKKIIVSRTARSCVSMCVWRCVFPQQTGHSLHTHTHTHTQCTDERSTIYSAKA